MKTLPVRAILTLLMCLGMIAGGALAQDEAEAPIIVFNEGDLWMWNGANGGMQQMTFWGYNQQPVLSPDGTHIAYMAWSQVTVDAIEREGSVAGGEVPGDIKIMDITTREEIIIAAQPEDAAFFSPDLPDKAVIRSKPAWSPDGGMLAWTEYDFPGEGVSRTMAYHMANGEVEMLVSALPPQVGVPVPMDVTWGESGLVLQSFTTNESDLFQTAFLVYDPDAPDRLLATIPVMEDVDRFLLGFVLVKHEGKEYIGAGYNTGEWDLFDPLTGESLPAPGVPEMYSPTAPDKSLSFALVASGSTGIRYQLLDVNGDPISDPFDMGFDALTHMAVAPDGQSAAYLPFNSDVSAYSSWVTMVEDDGAAKRVEVNPYGFAFMWGPIAWRIRPVKD